jgi:hypothetical protein
VKWSGGEDASGDASDETKNATSINSTALVTRVMSLDAQTAIAEMEASIIVYAMAEGTPPLTYNVSFTALHVQFEVGDPRVFTVSGEDVSKQPLKELRTLEIDATQKGVPLPEDMWGRLQVFLGPFAQTTTAIRLPGQL